MCSKSFTVATAEYLRLGNVPRTALNSGKPKIEGLMSGMGEDIIWRERNIKNLNLRLPDPLVVGVNKVEPHYLSASH